MQVLLTSASPDFYRVFPRAYLAARRAGLEVQLEVCDDGWALQVPDHAAARARELLGLGAEPSPDVAADAMDRSFIALLLLRDGPPIEEIAAALPNRAKDEGGVSVKSAEIIIRSAMRTLLSCVLQDRPPAQLPPELWPPARVRDEIRGARSGRTWRSQLHLLKDWVTREAEG
jgi:hypothetical protein